MTTASISGVQVQSRSVPAAMPWVIRVAVLATTSIILGIIWDISWHRTIGRDTFWTPAHMAIYLGSALAGLSSAWLVLRATFHDGPERGPAVRIWGFRGPLGAWIVIWGAVAMLTSAPLDNWWHGAYGLDVKILSPPHVVLGLGMIAIQVGILILVLSYQNRAGEDTRERLGRVFTYTAAMLLLTVVTIFMEENLPNNQHRGAFYRLSAIVYPLFLVAVARASSLRWPATGAAAVYMALSCAMSWILPLFPAKPLLAPILMPVDHMVPPPFPLLLIVPAVAMDLWLQRVRGRDWRLAAALGATFVWIFFVVQYWFAELMISPRADNWFFAGHQWGFFTQPSPRLYQFWGQHVDPLTFRTLVVATLLAAAAARVGLWWGNWMRRVVR
jgi:hypothetical protein